MMVVVGLTHTLQMMVEQIAELESEIARALGAHPDGAIFRAFFRSPDAVICAATLLSEIGDCRARYPHRDSIAADGGQAPVAIESGKRKGARFGRRLSRVVARAVSERPRTARRCRSRPG